MTGPDAPVWLFPVLAGVFGALFGSFFNVVIHRLPRGQSLVSPPSACPACGTRIAPYDNVPVFGWLFLGGKCRSCRAPISPRYPLVEGFTALLFAALAWHYGPTPAFAAAVVFASLMLLVTLIDFDTMTIPFSLSIPGIGLGVAASFVTDVTLVDSLVGMVAGFLFMFGIAWGYEKATGREGLGGGDIWLAALLGAWLGWQGLLLTVFLASGVGTIVGITLMARKRGTGRTALPYGTFLAPAGVAAMLWGQALVRAYLDFVYGL